MSERWNFDFCSEIPIEGSWEWESLHSRCSETTTTQPAAGGANNTELSGWPDPPVVCESPTTLAVRKPARCELTESPCGPFDVAELKSLDNSL
eukprot:scaffold12771_cov27-Prasinocladus_malaysianus.AAC.1